MSTEKILLLPRGPTIIPNGVGLVVGRLSLWCGANYFGIVDMPLANFIMPLGMAFPVGCVDAFLQRKGVFKLCDLLQKGSKPLHYIDPMTTGLKR